VKERWDSCSLCAQIETLSRPRDLHFIAFSCYERGRCWDGACAQPVLGDSEQVRRRCVASIAGYVVMPEHVHLLLSEPKKGHWRIVASVEGAVCAPCADAGTQGQRQLSLPFRIARRMRRFWQRRYYDFNVYSAQKIREKLTTSTKLVQRNLVMHPRTAVEQLVVLR